MSNNKIILYDKNFFDVEKTALSGQVFRAFKICGGWRFLSRGFLADCVDKGDVVEISTEQPEYFARYFDLKNRYDFEHNCWGSLGAVLEYCQGLRLLCQDPFETIVSFIISANNNIPRIQSIIERLCKACGENYGKACNEDSGQYYAFPTVGQLVQNKQVLYEIGAGYRAEYLADTVDKIAGGFDLDKPFALNTDDARKYLFNLKGVGPKVADCILLFAYQKGDVFPVDTWIKKAANQIFKIDEQNPEKINKQLVEMFGKNSGLAQQYLFYYVRGKLLPKNSN